eukprot:symbB.v1.2.032581.t1/scaffold3929.1/size57123/6
MLLQDLKRCGLEAEGIRLGQRCFCSAAAFGAFRPSGARDLTTACYLLDIPEGSPGSVWRSTHSALVDAVLTAKVVLAILSKVAIEEGRTVPGAASLSLPCRLSTPARLPETDAREQRGQKRRLPNSFATRAESLLAREESNSFLLETVQRIKVPGVLPLSLDVEEAPTLPPMLCKRKKHYRKQGRKVMGMVSSKSRRRVSINGSLH